MNDKKLYTISDIASLTDLPPSTVAYYKNNYQEFYPSQNVKGRRYPAYEEQAVEVTELIRDMYNKGEEKHDIYKRLEGKYQPFIDLAGDGTGDNEKQPETTARGQPTNNGTTALETIGSQNKILYRLGLQQQEWIQNQDNLLEHYKKQTTNQREVIESLENKIVELEQEVESLGVKLEAREGEVKELEKKLKPGLLNKLFK